MAFNVRASCACLRDAAHMGESGNRIASQINRMADLDVIHETLRRQRRDIDDALDSTSTRRDETSKIVDRLGNLRRRVERTRADFGSEKDK